MKPNRRRFLQQSVGAAALPLLPHAVQAADAPGMRVSAITISDCAPFYAALQQGFFTAAGIDVSTESETGGTVGIPAVVAGAYDVVYSNIPSILQALSQGIDLRFIAGGNPLNPPDTTGLYVRRGEGLKTGKDFEGKSIGINDTKSLQFTYAHGWVKATGGDADKVTYRAIPFPDMADAVKNKRVDGVIPSDPFYSALKGDPALELIANPGRVVYPNGRVAAWVVTGDYLAKHADLVRKFLAGMNRGSAWCNANLNGPAYTQLLVSMTKLDPARVATMAKGKTSIGITAREVARMADLLRANNLLSGSVDIPSKVFVP
ncbi:MAG: ABC transporter substrate-binding protein [Candidatus Lustribacter sp.]